MGSKKWTESWTVRLSGFGMAIFGILGGLEVAQVIPPGTTAEAEKVAEEGANLTPHITGFIVSLATLLQRFRGGAGGQLSGGGA